LEKIGATPSVAGPGDTNPSGATGLKRQHYHGAEATITEAKRLHQ